MNLLSKAVVADGGTLVPRGRLPHWQLREPRPIYYIEENLMSLGTILLIILILMLIGAIPTWPHSRSWGYGPSGGLGLVVIIILILLVTGRL